MKGSSALADVVIGPHSVLTEWVFETTSRLAALEPQRPLFYKTDRFDSIDFLASPRPICLTNYPSRSLIEAIEAGDARVILVIEDPIDVVRYLQGTLRISVMEAIRAQTATAVANLAISRSEHVHYLYRTTERTVGEIVTRIAEHLNLTPRGTVPEEMIMAASCGLGGDATLEAVLAARGKHYLPPVLDTAGIAIDPAVLTAAEVIAPLLAMARNDIARPVVWPTAVFTFKDRPDLPPPRTIEIAGPVRDLYYGPYFHLPPGRYRVEAHLAFSDEIKDVPFVLELHGAAWLARARIDERRAGDYRGYFNFNHTDPTVPVEIRLRNERGVSRGRLSLIELLFFNIPSE